MEQLQFGRSEIAKLSDRLETVLKKLPEEKRRLLEQIGGVILARVRANIGGTGKVQKWQDSFVGSKGGYAAVRALAHTVDEHGDAAGYLTNAIENGHVQQKGRYVPGLGKRLVKERVSGKGFYAAARTHAEQLAYQAAEEFIRAIAGRLEG